MYADDGTQGGSGGGSNDAVGGAGGRSTFIRVVFILVVVVDLAIECYSVYFLSFRIHPSRGRSRRIFDSYYVFIVFLVFLVVAV